MITVIFKLFGVSLGNDSFCAFIQHDDPLGNGEDACEFMGDDHHGCSDNFVEL